MADLREIITDALGEIGVLAAGEVANAEDALFGLRVTNRLIDQWAAERLMIYKVVRTTFSLVSGTATYTVGASGTVNVARPVYIDHLTYYDSTDSPLTEEPISPLTEDAWAKVKAKAQTNPDPVYYYYSPTFPLGTLTLYPVPTGTTLVGVLYAPNQVTEFAAGSTGLDTAISLPPGYRRMLVTNIAVEMAPSYEKQPSAELKEHAIASKMVVKNSNIRLMDMSIDSAWLGSSRGGHYNVYTD